MQRLRPARQGGRRHRERLPAARLRTIQRAGLHPRRRDGVWGSTASSLEYYSSDFAISQLAGRLGNTSVANNYLLRSQGWRNLLHDNYLQPRNSDGSWISFNPSSGTSYVEGNGAQYTWMVPFNYQGLFAGMGGNSAVLPRLDSFFSDLNAGPDKPNAYLGNEPTSETPWAYAFAGAPYKTQDVVRRAVTTIYKPTPDGEVGNDDLGQMSSWAVWASLGMYPEIPGRSELVLASPLFSQITITRGNGATITITAPERLRKRQIRPVAERQRAGFHEAVAQRGFRRLRRKSRLHHGRDPEHHLGYGRRRRTAVVRLHRAKWCDWADQGPREQMRGRGQRRDRERHRRAALHLQRLDLAELDPAL
nr:glycoside hydrolase domain-containing protein [Fodinicola feengrottensis]